MSRGPDSGALIAKVIVPAGHRPVIFERVRELADSIKQIGLLSPIVIAWRGEGSEECDLVAGRHRLEACRLLGWKRIPAVSRASIPLDEQHEESPELARLLNQLTEVDENLCRAELSALDRGEATAKRKRIYEQLHPETRPGRAENCGKGAITATSSKVATVAAFTSDTAAKTGRSERSIRRDAQIGEALTPAAAEVVRGTPVEDSPRALVEVSRVKDPDKQVQKAKLKVMEASEAETRKKRGGITKREDAEAKAAKVLKVVDALDDNARIAFFTMLVDRYGNHLKWAR